MKGKIPDVPLPGGYTFRGRLGRGALGTSFLAEKRGAVERRVFKILDHPEWLDEVAILRVPGVWIEGKSPEGKVAWIWSRHVPQGSLRGAMDQGTLPARKLGTILGECLEILGRVHREELVHGCLKPEDILLPSGGGVGITDFGHLPLLRSKDEAAGAAYLFGRVVSRDLRAPFAYLPPEALESNLSAPRCDVYAIGAILREGLEGKGGRPPIPASLREVIRVLTGPPSADYPSAEDARSLLESVPMSDWEEIPLIGESPAAPGEAELPIGGMFSFTEIPDRPVPVAVSLPREIGVFDLAGGPPEPSPPSGEGTGGSGGDDPEPLDPAEALRFLDSMKKKTKGKKKPEPEPKKEASAPSAGGSYGLVVMGVSGGEKREAIADLIGPLLNITKEQALEKAAEPVISVLQGVTKLEAEKTFRRFQQAKVSARITTRLQK